MKRTDLFIKTNKVKDDTKTALQTMYGNLNKGQKKKIAKVPEVAELFERYGVEVKE